MIAFSGVRISWLMFARKTDFARAAASAVSRARARSSAARFSSVTSFIRTTTPWNFSLTSSIRLSRTRKSREPSAVSSRFSASTSSRSPRRMGASSSSSQASLIPAPPGR